MQTSGWIIGSIVLVAAIIILVFKKFHRKQVFKGRNLLSLEEIYNDGIIEYGISFELFKKLSHSMGEAYNFDPRLLRPDDQLKMFFDLDSWDLDEGTNSLNKFIENDLGITFIGNVPNTFLDLLISLDKQLRERNKT